MTLPEILKKMKHPKFLIIINPFDMHVRIAHKDMATQEFYIQDTVVWDYWHAFKLDDGREYDMHILYDETIEVSIYPFLDDHFSYEKSIPHKVKIVY